MRSRDELVGRPVFDAFPDNPDDPSASGVSMWGGSLQVMRRNTDALHGIVMKLLDVSGMRSGHIDLEQHSGTITVSEPGEAATTFTVRLPAGRPATVSSGPA